MLLVINIWLGQNTICVNYGIAIIFGISGSLMTIRTILATFSNGLCEIKVQTICLTLGAVLNIPLAYLFTQIMHSYIAIVIANIVSMLPYCIVQPISFRKKFKITG
jgi:O-antigen/teichoic acid export membrane protein